MELKEIIQEYKTRYQLTNEEIAKQFHVSHTTVGRWLKGEIKTLQEETAENISHILGFDINALIQGKTITLKKPILGITKAGYDMYLDENYLGEENITLEEYNQGDFFLKVVGDSMIESGINDGSLIYVKKCQQVNHGDIAVFSIGDEVTVKKYLKVKDGIVLHATNPSVEDHFYSNQDIEELPVRIIGKVIFSKNYF